jgi:hypothetical protein
MQEAVMPINLRRPMRPAKPHRASLPPQAKALRKQRNRLEQELLDLFEELWTGKINSFDFVEQMQEIMGRYLDEAFYTAADAVGLLRNEVIERELDWLTAQIDAELPFYHPLAEFIRENQRTGGSFGDVENRSKLWSNEYERVYHRALTIFDDDVRLKWFTSPSKEHCTDCAKMDGRVYRASTWRNAGVYPRDRKLECRGYKCGCGFEVTQDALTPGAPPRVRY